QEYGSWDLYFFGLEFRLERETFSASWILLRHEYALCFGFLIPPGPNSSRI
ncbi:16105_t:CDS:2, partial [Rhizophagus irregularis]